MRWSSRTRATYRALHAETLRLGRPPTRAELVAAIAEPWADTSQVGKALSRLESGGYVEDGRLVRTDDGRTVTYLVELSEQPGD